MTRNEMMERALQLEVEIQTASEEERLARQPEFCRLITRLKADGEKVPGRLRSLDAALCDEAAEDQFDNMPV